MQEQPPINTQNTVLTPQFEEFLHAVATMRRLQKNYFSRRLTNILEQAKKQEQLVDALLQTYLPPARTNTQQTLPI